MGTCLCINSQLSITPSYAARHVHGNYSTSFAKSLSIYPVANCTATVVRLEKQGLLSPNELKSYSLSLSLHQHCSLVWSPFELSYRKNVLCVESLCHVTVRAMWWPTGFDRLRESVHTGWYNIWFIMVPRKSDPVNFREFTVMTLTLMSQCCNNLRMNSTVAVLN